MDTKMLDELLLSKGLVGSGIGLWWLKKINGEYYYFHTESSYDLYKLPIEEYESEKLYGSSWQKTAKKLFARYPEYERIIEETQSILYKLLIGELNTCTYSSPWLNSKDELILVTDQVYVVSKNEDGTPSTVVGVTLNNTVRNKKLKKYAEMEEINQKLLQANNNAVELAGFLIWSMNLDDQEKSNRIYCNELYAEKLGLKRYKEGYTLFEDFQKTVYPDYEGKESMRKMMEPLYKPQKNGDQEFLEYVVKHQNLITKEAVYLEHNTKIDALNDDFSVKKLSGYVLDITEQVSLEKNLKELNRKNKELLRAQNIAVKSGKLMIWYLNNEDPTHNDYFYGNQLLFSKLGLEETAENTFRITDFNNSVYDEDVEGLMLKEKYFELDDSIVANEMDSYEKLLVKHINRKTGEIFYLEHNFEVEERYPDGRLKIRGGFITDVTTETEMSKYNDFLINNDVLTQLYNRNSFERFIVSKDLPKQYCLLIADIDGLKFINDAFGHIRGDEIISQAAKILQDEFGRDSKCYRIGGDEFAIISHDIIDESINQRIGNIRECIENYCIDNNTNFNMSIGYEIVSKGRQDFRAAFITAENIMYRRKLVDRNSRKSRTMETVLATLNEKTEETKEHCDRVGQYAVMTLKEMGYVRTAELDDIQLLSKVHDIGKITVSEEILSKPGKLTDEEYSKIKNHSEAGYKIVKNIVESDKIAFGVLYHHERYDGNGYPFGLKGDEIPLFAKILSVCDSFDVMITGRKYQQPFTIEEALEEIKRCSGTQFDPKIADTFISSMSK